jgi:hypothetical protein
MPETRSPEAIVQNSVRVVKWEGGRYEKALSNFLLISHFLDETPSHHHRSPITPTKHSTKSAEEIPTQRNRTLLTFCLDPGSLVEGEVGGEEVDSLGSNEVGHLGHGCEGRGVGT